MISKNTLNNIINKLLLLNYLNNEFENIKLNKVDLDD